MALERTAIPREFSDHRRFTRRFRLILAGVILAAVSGPIGCMAAVANRPVTTPAPAAPRYQDYAAAVAESYLDGQSLPVPVARGLDPDGGREAADPRAGASGEDPRPAPIPHSWVIPMDAGVAAVPGAGSGSQARRSVETHRFLVGTPSGPFVLAVPLVDTPHGPALGALPSIEPFVPDARAAEREPLDWTTAYATVRPSAAVQQRVDEWAKAFAADDRRRLLEITGDGRTDVVYVGLGAWTLAGEPQVSGLFTRADGTAGTTVELALVASHDRKVTTRVAFDLLVRHADDALPEIVAWGPAGSALRLTPFENASHVPADGAEGTR